MLQLRTFGTFELTGVVDGTPIRLMGPQKPLAMLAYIALAPGRRVTRDQLVDLLWRNLEVERGRRTLRQTLFSIRQKLGDVLGSDGEYLVLTAPLTVDCQQFDEARERGDLEEAWRLYTGRFVADFATAGSAPFEQWCDRQRDRLQTAWFGVGGELIRRALVERPLEAAALAAQLRDAAPERPEWWSARIRALTLAGERVKARAEAQRVQRSAAAGALAITADLRQLLRELDGAAVTAAPEEAPQWRRPDLVGREGAFALLLADWQRTMHATAYPPAAGDAAPRGGPAHGSIWVVRGSPGIGKTVLLEEFSQRARGIGGQVLTIRARRVNARTPFSLAAMLADAVVSLPGAMGVSPATAALLVDLSPALSSTFRATAPRSPQPDELLRLRTQALQELLTTVADERPTLVIVDDLHWADESSRQMLATLGEVLPAALQLVVGMRPTRRWVAPDTARFIDLPPLSLEQIELLLASVASADTGLLRELAGVLLSVSGGIPLLAVSALDLAFERQLLTLTGDAFQCPDPEALRHTLGQGGVLEKLLAGVSPAGREVLTALAVADGALSARVLAASVPDARVPDARVPDVEGPDTGGSGITDDLLNRGLVVQGTSGLEIAHDELAGAALAVVRDDERREITRRVGRALLDERPETAFTLSLAGRLLAEGGDARVVEAFHRWLAFRDSPSLWRDPMRAAGDYLGAAANPHLLTRLTRSVPLLRRLGRGHPQATKAVAAIGVVLALLGFARSTGMLREPAVAMQMVEPVSDAGFIRVGRTDANDIPFSLGATLVDGEGLPTPRGPDSVTLSFEAEVGEGRLLGATTRAVKDGRVTFTGVSLSAGAIGRFVVRAEGLPPVRSRRLILLRADDAPYFGSLRIRSGTLNGQPVDTAHRQVVVRPGALLTGTVELQATTTEWSAALLAGAVALWGDRRSNFITLLALPARSLDVRATVPFEDLSGQFRVLRAPAVPGVYHLLLLFSTETEFRYVASGTNWSLGTPIWNDGNDVADFTPLQIEELRKTGRTYQRYIVRVPRSRDSRIEPRLLPGTVIDVIVR